MGNHEADGKLEDSIMGELKNIYVSIASIMGKIGAIGKDKFNPNQKYKYRGVDDVMNALAPLLAEEKIIIVPEVLEHSREERISSNDRLLIYSICKIRYTFYAADGSHVEAVVIGEGMDSGDKASNKAMAVAFKYACFQVFCIPTEESKEPAGMKDPDSESPEVKGKVPESKNSVDKSQPITLSMAKALRQLFANNGIDENKVIASYKLNALEQLNIGQHNAILKNLNMFKEKCGIEQDNSNGKTDAGSGNPV